MEDPEAGGTWHHAPCHLASNLSAKAFSTVASTSKFAKSYSFWAFTTVRHTLHSPSMATENLGWILKLVMSKTLKSYN